MFDLVPLNAKKYKTLSWSKFQDYRFASKFNIIPVVIAELADVIATLPLAFVRYATGELELVAIAALKNNENWFITPAGKWVGGYVPAALRSYPFGLIRVADAGQKILGIDESSGLIHANQEHIAFFDDSGEHAAEVKNIVHFLQKITENKIATDAAVQSLDKANIIEPWPLGIQEGDDITPVEGLYRINEGFLNNIDELQFYELRKKNALALAYAQLFAQKRMELLQRARSMYINQRAHEHLLAQDSLDFEIGDDTLKF
ncbi:SapC family protein [Desulfurispirillum indicum]|uniref:SapC family protein n=1 Tax=Desulfurispirillum indicum TaxID=936456 RepID=UPI0005A0FF0A|nr:SapC family protein [Desulfurispirillum indicum]